MNHLNRVTNINNNKMTIITKLSFVSLIVLLSNNSNCLARVAHFSDEKVLSSKNTNKKKAFFEFFARARGLSSVRPNSSFLNNHKIMGETMIGSLQKKLFNQTLEEKLKNEKNEMDVNWDPIRRNWSEYSNHGLISRDQQIKREQTKSAFAKHVLSSIFNFQMDDTLKTAEKNSEEIRTFRKVQKQVENISVETAIAAPDSKPTQPASAPSNGGSVDSKPAIATTKTNEPALSSSLNQEPIEKFDPKILVGGKLDLPRQEAKIWMTSSIVNSNFDVVIGDWERKDPTAIAGPFALGLLKERSMSEKYRLKFYRDLPLAIRAESVFGLGNLDLKGGVLRSSLKRNIELPKKVPGNLEAGVVVDNTPFAITPESRRGEQKILMDYTLNF